MPQQGGHIYFEKSKTFSPSYKLGDDPRPLQMAFAALFDEAAQAIYLAGSDLDEVLVERIYLVRTKESVHEVPADFLADEGCLRKSVLHHFAQFDRSDQTKSLRIIAVKIIARHDELNR